MQFKIHLYVQKHLNRTYTVTPLPFYDLTVFGNNYEELKRDIRQALTERIKEMSPWQLGELEFRSNLKLHKVFVEVRPTDRKTRKKRREKLRIQFSLLVEHQEDDQLWVRVPRLGNNGPSYYVYSKDELTEQSQLELGSWLDGSTLDQLQSLHHARTESLDVLEFDVDIKKPTDKDKKDDENKSLFGGQREKQDKFWALKEIGVNLTAQFSEGRYRRTYHRDTVVQDILQTLSGVRNNSVLLVGESETGKTAIIHEVVRRMINKACPDVLQEREVWMLSPDRIIAGAQYIGTWEERLQDIVEECRKKQHILYIEDLPGLLEIGRWSKSDANVAQALRPHVASGEVIILGEGLPDRVTMGENLGAGFMNQFRRVEVSSMSEQDALSVLGSVSRDLERQYNARILPEASQTAVQLSQRFTPYRSFPGKAIRLLEEAAASAANKVAPPPPRPQRRGASLLNRSNTPSTTRRSFPLFRRRAYINRRQIMSTFARVSGLPEFIINDHASMNLDEVETYFKERILGQETAVSTVVNLIATIKAGLNDPGKPLGTLMFIGPTGVGKTQMAKTLAKFLFGDEERLIRFDMSEYRDMDGVAKLIGVFGKDGELTKQVREQPFSVILLDEFEKADPRIYDIFLQVFGEGRLTDANGKTTFFQNSVIIMTSNLGAGAKNFSNLGFGVQSSVQQSAIVDEALREHYRRQVENYFRPEFVNRIDHQVIFGQLSPQALRDIATREMGEILLRDGITRRNLLVEIEDNVIDVVLEQGYSPEFGARPLKRAIERIVVAPMARDLAQRSAKDTQLMRVSIDPDTDQLKLKNIPISEGGGEHVELRSSLRDTTYRKLRMDADQLVEGFATLRRKLGEWNYHTNVVEMRKEKDQLLAASQDEDLWKSSKLAGKKMGRFYFLDRLLQRLKELNDRAEELEDIAVLVKRERDNRYQPELAEQYEELFSDISYLDIELRTAHLPHRNKAMMLLQSVGGLPTTHRSEEPHKEWIRRLATMYLQWAEQKGYNRDLYVLKGDPKRPNTKRFVPIKAGRFEDMLVELEKMDYTDEIAMLIEGSNAFGFLKGESGLHRLDKDNYSEDMVQLQVYAIPDHTDIEEWLRDYWDIRVDIAMGNRQAPKREKLSIVRIYSLDKGLGERFIRDTRTNIRTADIQDVMEKGQLDDFILGFLEQDGISGWDDRNPPTFPF